VLKIIGNIIWLLLGGIELAIAYAIAGIVMMILIITIPWALGAFRLAAYSLWPFGRRTVRTPSAGSILGNVIWIILAGWWLAIGHLIAALLCAITIIGIPFAVVHWRLAGLALRPLGVQIVDADAPAPADSVELQQTSL
jgi:uncharacterized membrane protein YccF (DUF307 family)